MRPYQDPRWRTVRLAVLARDQHQCQLKLPRCRGKATEVDHIIDWQDGGAPFEPSNLRGACKPCNVSLRNQRVAERARAHRNGITRAEPSREW